MDVETGTPLGDHPIPAADREEIEFEAYREAGSPGLARRFVTTLRHLLALSVGGLAARDRALPLARRWSLPSIFLRMLIAVPYLFVDRRLRRRSFPVQLRRRLERLGPTYIKLGQILSLREDLLPAAVTDELKTLLDRLPAVSFPRFLQLISRELGRPADEVFAYIQPQPLGSASIGQIHLATTHEGERVILKVVKPDIRDIIRRDTVLLRGLGAVLRQPVGELSFQFFQCCLSPFVLFMCFFNFLAFPF